jgi:ATP-dependent DNA helicase RecG
MPNTAPKTVLEQLTIWMAAREDEHLEFKEAKNNFHFEKLVQYCCALANEQGGQMILGVTDRKPRRVVGTAAFENLERTKAGLTERLHLRIDTQEIAHPDGRVIVFHVPSRPIGMPVQFQGTFWMRSGEDLVGMTPDQLKRIFDEAVPDFSAEVLASATLAELDPQAIQEFRSRWHRKSGNDSLLTRTDAQLLDDAGLVTPDGITRAALILLGTPEGVRRHSAQSEVVFEYRSSEASIPHQERLEWTAGYLGFHDQLWAAINKRNERQPFRDGMFQLEIATFNEVAVREVVLNAISHRDYRRSGSVFVRQFPRKITVVSPGGLPTGMTLENILTRQDPRNRLIANALLLCGLIERSGQGMDLIYTSLIRESKAQPDFANTDDYQVSISLNGEVQNPEFLRFLEKVGQERLKLFSTEDFLILDAVEQRLPESLKARAVSLLDLGVLERTGRGKFVLARGFYEFAGRKGEYTRKRGLDHETNKALLFKHITDNALEGSRLSELDQVLPALSTRQVQLLLAELKVERKVHPKGSRNLSRWYPGPG